ncbi:MAG: glycosyltransferase [Mediterranea sp.]|jgi:glycosyltransferase involved in cell wall biosynthesis|nr:glycosyltransferase [Mediterranea sp.]
MEKISIIIPVYNVEKQLSKCLESVIGQTYSHLEIIVVNDGSPDNSGFVISSYAAQDNRIVVVNQTNGGLSDARNAGMEVAIGDYLCFLDGDDWLEADFVEKMHARMVSESLDLVCCEYRYVWENGNRQDKHFMKDLPPVLMNQEAIAAFLKQQILASVAIKMFKRCICEEHQLRFLKGILWEDMIFTFNYLFFCQKIGIIHHCLYDYFQAPESISRTKETLNVLHWMLSAEQCVQMNEEKNPGLFKEENRCLITKAFIGLLVYAFKSKNPEIQHRLREEMQIRKHILSLHLLSIPEKLLIILYKLNYPLARFIFLNVYKKVKSE